MQRKEYLIIGSNNFWYAACLDTKKEAIEQAREIMEGDGSGYADPETGHEPEKPETLYIYEAKEIQQIEAPEEEGE